MNHPELVKLGLPDVLAVLHSTRRIHPDKAGMFLARVKHLRRLGFPEGANTGSGKHVEYSLEQTFQLVIAFELIGAGLPPQRAIQITMSDWPRIRGWIAMAAEPPTPDRRIYFVTMVDALRDMSVEGASHDVRTWEMVHRVFDKDLLAHIALYPGAKSVFDATGLVGQVTEQLERRAVTTNLALRGEFSRWRSTGGND